MNEVSAKRAAGLSWWKWLLLVATAAMISMSWLWAKDLEVFISPKTTRIIFWHVPMAILSMVWFFMSAFYSVRYLVKRNTFDDARASKAAEIGLLLTVLATVTGAVFSKMQWAGGFNSPWYMGYWQWDPKQTAIVIVIIIFTAYFGLRMSIDNPETRARLSSAYAVLGAIAVPFLYYTLPHLPIFGQNSLHPQNIVNEREAMDTPYRVTFYLAILVFHGYSVWAYQLQLRLARLEERAQVGADVATVRRIEAVRKPLPEQ